MRTLILKQLQRLQAIIKQLRDPITGCEWDKVQTPQSLKSYTLEETYEVLDAIDKQDSLELKKELGDLLFHIIFYADLANEKGEFNFSDICEGVADKLERRHPHIFGDNKIDKPNWEQLKQKERNQKSQYSLLDDIPDALPALMRAEKIQKRCASVGFDWDTLSPVIDKVNEELDEVMQELAQTPINQESIEEEVGDLLFATVNLARHLKIKPEICLQKANKKFERRFKQVETLINQNKGALIDATIDEMEQAWQQVKQLEKLNNKLGE